MSKKNLLILIGPCVIESEKSLREIASELCSIMRRLGVKREDWFFKASFDKANRSSPSSYRGVKLDDAAVYFQKIRDDFGCRVVTDIHLPEQAAKISHAVDMLQIPAFLCRQSDLLKAAADTALPLNVKKGQFLAPWDVKNIAAKLEAFGCKDYCFTERGSSFGYGHLVADMRALHWMRSYGYRVIFDATHSSQMPGQIDGKITGGDSSLAPVLAKAAVAAGCDGVFIETHPNPAKALSDSATQIPLSELEDLLSKLLAIHQIT